MQDSRYGRKRMEKIELTKEQRDHVIIAINHGYWEEQNHWVAQGEPKEHAFLDKVRALEYLGLDVDIFRTCTRCKERMKEGYVFDDGMEYYCSSTCLHSRLDEKEWDALHEELPDDYYWTSWESSCWEYGE